MSIKFSWRVIRYWQAQGIRAPERVIVGHIDNKLVKRRKRK